MPCLPRAIAPLTNIPVPSPSDTSTTTRSSIWPLSENHTSERAHAFATLSMSTCRFVSDSILTLRLTIGHRRFGAPTNTTVSVTGFDQHVKTITVYHYSLDTQLALAGKLGSMLNVTGG